MKTYTYNDIEALQEIVSKEWGDWSNEFTVTQDIINQFADMTNDHNWIHTDVERCKKESPFGGPIAHGFLTLVLMPQMIVPKTFEITGYTNAVNYGLNKVRNMGSVPAGATIHQRMRVDSVEKTSKGTQVVMVGAIHIVGQERPSVIYEMVMLYM
ncbi:MAG: MaoC family dehydratase [Pseudomonadales bacterium]|nr:MaoC family dehydratase [Pseudomonadales bacterium]